MMKQTCRIAHHGNETVVKPPPAFKSVSTNSSISTSMLLTPYRGKSCWYLWGTIHIWTWAEQSAPCGQDTEIRTQWEWEERGREAYRTETPTVFTQW